MHDVRQTGDGEISEVLVNTPPSMDPDLDQADEANHALVAIPHCMVMVMEH